MKTKELGGGETVFYKKLFSLVLPIAFQQFMLAAVSASDAVSYTHLDVYKRQCPR